jgi:lipopolysaccharide/colanic/teichoic acid biosynthesis glycosyltransferase
MFKQERIGLYGTPFWIYKFRTMHEDAEAVTGPVLSEGICDARLTKVGRWLRLLRVDEIPQLWNVLRDEMSLVGPRPERTCFVREFEQSIPTYSRRHQVRPGITGLAQVCGGYHTGAGDKLRFDLIYIAHQSVWYDLAILLRTVLVVIFPRSKGGGGSVASRQASQVDAGFVNHL